MYTFDNYEQYTTAKHKLDQYEAAALKYRTDNKTNGIPVEICNSFPFANEVDNNLRSAIETYEFISNPPDKYFIYINESKCIATTWTGQPLGSVSFGQEYRSNMGDKRQPVSILGINGRKYHGTYYKSSGNYARIKIKK